MSVSSIFTHVNISKWKESSKFFKGFQSSFETMKLCLVMFCRRIVSWIRPNGKVPSAWRLGFLAKTFLGFLEFLPRSWQLILAKFTRICKIFQGRGKKSKKILGNKSKNNQDLGQRNKKVLYQNNIKSIDIL